MNCRFLWLLWYLNSRTATSCKLAVAGEGKLQVVNKEGTSGSDYYTEKIIEAIGSDKTIDISISETFTVNGTTYDIDEDAGGGLTAGNFGEDQQVVISGNENTKIKDEDGNQLEDKPADILVHELVGHAIPKIVGPDTGDAVKNANKVRRQQPKIDCAEHCVRETNNPHPEY